MVRASRAAALVVAALVVLAGAAARGAEVDDPDVLVLTEDNFDATVGGEETMLVEFYAPWCGHCKSLAPEYAKAATELLQEDPPVRLGKVDATEHGALAQRFGVGGYPTLKVMRNGQPNDYRGPRDAAGIVKYMRKQAGPAARTVSTQEELDAVLAAGADGLGFWVLGLFPEKTSRVQSAFTLVAARRREDYVFLRTTSAALVEKYGGGAGDTDAVVALKTFDEERVLYEGSGTSSNLEAFVDDNALPLVGEHTAENRELYSKRNSPMLKLYVSRVDRGSKQERYYVNRLRPTARHHAGKLLVTLVDAGKNAGETADLGVTVTDKSPAMVIEVGQAKYVRQPAKFSKDAVAAFVEDWANDRVEKHVKSEPVPAENDGPVRVVVGKTFDEIVDDRERDVLVEFYAPWCGHCKKLEPVYQKVGKAFRKEDSVVIAKIDATANDYPRSAFRVSGFPTLYLAPAGGGAPIEYDGGRTKEELVEFVRKNAVKPLSKKKKKKKGKKGKKKKKAKADL